MPKFIYTGIHVSNLERSIAFYTKELGMTLMFKTKIKETGGKVAWLRSPRSKQILELNWYPKRYKFGGRSGLDHLAFKVDDAKKYFDRLSKKKYKAPIKPFLEGSWVLAYVKDPDGNWIELSHLTKKRRK
ncbi:MAG: VOC family protein [Nitrososphaerales archaeon]